ncbi:MAG TPA: polymer-forming cytoskeletal protein [Gammaproteobacteria bacterium]
MSMWGQRKKSVAGKIDTLVGQLAEITGDIRFSGGLHVDGSIKGDVIATSEADAVLILSEHGRIEGDVRVPNIVLNGIVVGDVHAAERIELAAKARVTGNVFYNLFEMAIGAEVNGNLVHRGVTALAASNAAPRLSNDKEADAKPIRDDS